MAIKIWQCLRCSHEWAGRSTVTAEKPKYCAKCHSPYWNTPRGTVPAHRPKKAKEEEE